MARNKAKTSAANSSVPAGATRPPVVVVLGHVDHGKTTLLDAIRKTEVAAREYGGITQSIGAYQVSLSPQGENSSREKEMSRGILRQAQDEYAPRMLTFIDTPGHEAFTKMRSRGVSVADIAVLVVAANDSVMPQTAESIKIIKEAKIPYVVAVNKIDLPEANFDKVVKDLLRHEVMLEGYGGDVPVVKVSAKKGEGVKELLGLLGLMADMAGLKGDDDAPLSAVIIESRMDKGRGPLGTAVVKNGTLRVGDEIYVEGKKSKIRALIDYKNEQISEVGPGTPVVILGLSTVPSVGTEVSSTLLPTSESSSPVTTAGLAKSSQTGEQSLNLILKADTVGALEAITATIPGNVNLLQSSVGEITDADVLLAKPAKAIILGFNVKVAPTALKLAEIEKVLVRTYKIIYELLDELADAAAGMLTPEETEETLGAGQIIAEFPFEKLRVAGTRVTDGRIARGDLVRVTRGEEVIGESKIKSARISREEANRVEKGRECGILLEPQVDFRVGDAIISYRIV